MRREPSGFLSDPGRDLSKRRALARWRDRRKPLRELAVNAKRPAADLSAPGVNSCVGLARRKTKSSPGRTRTYDKPVNSRLLYQLSYRGMGIEE